MVFSWTQCARLFALCALCISLVTAQVATPDKDPFYTPPPGFQFLPPGTILRTRNVTPAILGIIPNVPPSPQTYQVLFRTTASDGKAIASATTVFVPLNAMKDRFISFHTAYDGSAPICSPSYTYQQGAVPEDLITQFELLFLDTYLASGYIISSPDYESEDAAFGAGRLSGMVALDSMRAVSSFRDVGFTIRNPKIVGYGYSGGSIATGWAASLKNKYAPELPVVGWAQGGTVANLTGTAVYLDNTLFSGFIPPVINGLNKPASYRAELNPIIESIVTPYARGVLDFANEHCTADLFSFAEMSVLATSFQSLGDQLYYEPTIRSVLSRCTMGVNRDETPLNIPVYMYHAFNDEIVPYNNASTLVDTWCRNGAAVDFVTYQNGGHADIELVGFLGAYEFVGKAFDGTAQKSGCTRENSVTDSIPPLALGLQLEPITTRLIDALARIGRGDANFTPDQSVLSEIVDANLLRL